ncbi:hypothetical protein [uncultured Rhodospira sp.]|uniref:hypothetical protein n=1 Tax=uncultured Rhodospira sp. TaxID=1936189 RepID=UPI00260BEB0D|nr:hypothetical protein [uncultured Rhodospira sp.]
MLSHDLKSLHDVICATLSGGRPMPTIGVLADWARAMSDCIAQAEAMETAGGPLPGAATADWPEIAAHITVSGTGAEPPPEVIDLDVVPVFSLADLAPGSGCDVVPVVDLSEALSRDAKIRCIRALDDARRRAEAQDAAEAEFQGHLAVVRTLGRAADTGGDAA